MNAVERTGWLRAWAPNPDRAGLKSCLCGLAGVQSWAHFLLWASVSPSVQHGKLRLLAQVSFGEIDWLSKMFHTVQLELVLNLCLQGPQWQQWQLCHCAVAVTGITVTITQYASLCSDNLAPWSSPPQRSSLHHKLEFKLYFMFRFGSRCLLTMAECLCTYHLELKLTKIIIWQEQLSGRHWIIDDWMLNEQ